MVREGGRKRVRESLDDTESDGERERVGERKFA